MRERETTASPVDALRDLARGAESLAARAAALVRRGAGLWWAVAREALAPRREAAPDQGLVVAVGADGLAFAVRDGGASTPIATVATAQEAAELSLPEGPLRLEVPAEWVLCREVAFPVEVRRHLGEAVGLELDRLTPFAGGEAYLSVVQRPEVEGESALLADIRVVPRRLLDPVLAFLGALGLPPGGLVMAHADGRREAVPGLLPPPPLGALYRRHRTGTLLAALCCLGLLAAAGAPFLGLADAIGVREKRLAALSSELESQVRSLAPEGARLAALRALADAAAQDSKPLALLADISERLPREAHLLRILVKPGEAELTVAGGTPSEVLAALSASPRIADPRLATEGRAGEAYVIRMRTIRPGGGPPAPSGAPLASAQRLG
ncbi:MAG: hypothetical protein H6923_01385 [Alphaproteobacteria bacterium]|nr:hypothetical protein [Alphaproteobacteria bacterium]